MDSFVPYGNVFSTPSPELEDDDLSYLTSMIHSKETKKDPLDFNFLKNELLKRKPPNEEKEKGVLIPENQTKPSTRQPKYIKTRILQHTFSQTAEPENANETRNKQAQDQSIQFVERQSRLSSKPTTQQRSLLESKGNGEEEEESTKSTNPNYKCILDGNSYRIQKIKKSQRDAEIETETGMEPPVEEEPEQPNNTFSWKYVGFNGGNFGVYTGKVNCKGRPSSVQKAFAEIPYRIENAKAWKKTKKLNFNNNNENAAAIEAEEGIGKEDGEIKERTIKRNLFKLSINEGTKERQRMEEKKLQRKFRLKSKSDQGQNQRFGDQEEPDSEPESRLYLESGDKLFPLVPSRLHRPNR